MIDGMVMKVGELSFVNSDRSDSQNSSCACFFLLGGGTDWAVSGLNSTIHGGNLHGILVKPNHPTTPTQAQYMQGKGRGRGAPPATATVRNLEVTSNSAFVGSWGCDPSRDGVWFFSGIFSWEKTGKTFIRKNPPRIEV